MNNSDTQIWLKDTKILRQRYQISKYLGLLVQLHFCLHDFMIISPEKNQTFESIPEGK